MLRHLEATFLKSSSVVASVSFNNKPIRSFLSCKSSNFAVLEGFISAEVSIKGKWIFLPLFESFRGLWVFDLILADV